MNPNAILSMSEEQLVDRHRSPPRSPPRSPSPIRADLHNDRPEGNSSALAPSTQREPRRKRAGRTMHRTTALIVFTVALFAVLLFRTSDNTVQQWLEHSRSISLDAMFSSADQKDLHKFRSLDKNTDWHLDNTELDPKLIEAGE